MNPFTLKPDFSQKPNMEKTMFTNFNLSFFAYKAEFRNQIIQKRKIILMFCKVRHQFNCKLF